VEVEAEIVEVEVSVVVVMLSPEQHGPLRRPLTNWACASSQKEERREEEDELVAPMRSVTHFGRAVDGEVVDVY